MSGGKRPSNDPDGQRRPHKRWLMRFLALSLGLMPLVLLELGLRIGDEQVVEGVDLDPLVNLEQLRPLFVLDRATQRWIIPPERMNFFRPASFPATKSKGTKRIFVIGGSTVQGRPYATETAFSTWLQLRLQAASPQTSFQVINCGGVSYASYRVARILEEVLEHQPDAIVLYTGHNEFLEDRTYAQTRSMSTPRRWASRVGSQLRTVRWLRQQFADPATRPTELAEEVDAKLDHAGGLSSYRRDPAWRHGVEEHFAATLRRMVNRTQHAAVPLVLCVPASDLVNTPPIKIARLPGLSRWQSTSFDAAWQRATDNSLDDDVRLQACGECLSIDAEHAGAHYVAGRLLYQHGHTKSAITHLVAARDDDVCPLRATSAIVDAVLQIADERQLPLIDSNALLDRRDWTGAKIPDGMVDPELFVDHVHPTIVGHQILAAQIAAAIESLDWFVPVDAAEQNYQTLVAEHLGTLGEEYYARGKQRLAGLRRWAAGRAGDVGID